MMKQLVRLLLVAAIGLVAMTACSKDDKGGSVAVNPKALFLDWEEVATVHF